MKWFVSICSFFFVFSTASSQHFKIYDAFPTPSNIPFGLEWINGYLWHSDRGSGLIYKIDPSSHAVVRSFTPAISDPAGLCWTGTQLYCADWSAGTINRIDTSTGAVLKSFYSPNGSPFGLAWDGKNLWSTEVFARKLCKLDTNGTVLQSYFYPYWLHGITFDGTSFWVSVQDQVVNGSRKILRLKASGDTLLSYASPGGHPSDLAWDGSFMWIIDEQMIYKTRPSKVDSGFTILKPNGGEVWPTGSVQTILWATLNPQAARLDYTTNNGASWIPIASSVPANPQRYSWTVPNTPSTQCRIRITDLGDTSRHDVSDIAFTITPGRLGDLWQEVASGVPNTLFAVHVVDDSIAWASGSSGTVLRTTNGGEIWNTAGFVGADVHSIKGIGKMTALAAANGSDATIKKTTDGGVTWSTVFTQPGGFIDDFIMFNSINGIAIGDPVGGIWTIIKTSDGGTTWSAVSPVVAPAGEVGYNTATSVVGSTIWFTTNVAKIYKSTDYGETWISYPTVNPLLYSICFSNSLVGVAGTEEGIVNYSNDGGQTWKSTSTGGYAEIPGVASTDPRTFYLTCGYQIFKSSDGGVSWKANGLCRNYLRHISFSPSHQIGIAVGEFGAIMRYKQEYQIPALTLLHPNGGERYGAGSRCRIKWDDFLVNTVRIEFTSDNGLTWQPIGYQPGRAQSRKAKMSATTDVAGAIPYAPGFDWTTPIIESDSVRIRISDSLDASIVDVSSRVFTISSKVVRPLFHYAYDISTANSFFGLYGSEFDGKNFIVSQWSDPKGRLLRFDRNGSFIDSFTVLGMTTGFRDLAFDGRYLYGGSNSEYLYQVDTVTWSVVNTIVMPAGVTVRGVAYDQKRDAFWISNWYTDIVCVDRNSNIISRIPANKNYFEGISGLAYDAASAGGPFMWVFVGGDVFSRKILYKIDTLGNRLDSIEALTGVTTVDAVGGGCFVTSDLLPGNVIVGGILQGSPQYLIGWRVSAVTSVPIMNTLPNSFALEQNYPNPFNPTTTIRYSLPFSANIKLTVYDLLGREVATLVNEEQSAGWKEVEWNAKDVSSGIYFYKLTSGNFVETKKMLMLK